MAKQVNFWYWLRSEEAGPEYEVARELLRQVERWTPDILPLQETVSLILVRLVERGVPMPAISTSYAQVSLSWTFKAGLDGDSESERKGVWVAIMDLRWLAKDTFRVKGTCMCGRTKASVLVGVLENSEPENDIALKIAQKLDASAKSCLELVCGLYLGVTKGKGC